MPTQRKTAIITGAASGMGRAMALGLSEAGFDVAAVDRNAEALATLPAAIRQIRADLAQPDSFDKIVAETIGAFGRIDILINNAGIGQAAIRANQRGNPIRFWEITPEQWNRFLTVNATAPILMSRAVLPHMLKANSGRIITVTTSLGTMVRGGYLLYGSSKAAAEVRDGGAGSGSRRHRGHRQRSCARRRNRHAAGRRSGGPVQDAPAGDHAAAAALAGLGCRPPRSAAGASSRRIGTSPCCPRRQRNVRVLRSPG